MSAALLADGGKFVPPGPEDFQLPEIFGHGTFLTKPMLIVIVGTALIALFFVLAARKSQIVPGKLQFAAEELYSFVRNGIARDAIGHGYKKYVPFLATAFFFILVMNVSGIVPVVQFPATSKIAIPLFIALISWVLFNWVGIRRQGFVGYFKNMMFPPGVPWPVYIILAPIEFFSTVIVRPITLTLRLTLNMFAGHLVLGLVILGGGFLLEQGGFLSVLGPFAWLFGIVLSLFEGFIQLLQAYVFVLLSALYIAGALADEH